MQHFAAEDQSAGGFVFNQEQKWSICNEFEIAAKFVGQTDLCGRIRSASFFIDFNASLLQYVRHLKAILHGSAASHQWERCLIGEHLSDPQLKDNNMYFKFVRTIRFEDRWIRTYIFQYFIQIDWVSEFEFRQRNFNFHFL